MEQQIVARMILLFLGGLCCGSGITILVYSYIHHIKRKEDEWKYGRNWK